jgi:hypothetical protein
MSVKGFLWGLIPSGLRYLLFEEELEKLEEEPVVPQGVDVVWVDDQEEFEQELLHSEERYSNGLRRAN